MMLMAGGWDSVAVGPAGQTGRASRDVKAACRPFEQTKIEVGVGWVGVGPMTLPQRGGAPAADWVRWTPSDSALDPGLVEGEVKHFTSL